MLGAVIPDTISAVLICIAAVPGEKGSRARKCEGAVYSASPGTSWDFRICITICNTIRSCPMSDPMTLRLDDETRQRIARIARRKRLSASEVIRQAIEAWVEREEPIDSPYEVVADLIGVVHGGNPGRSSGTGYRFTELLKDRRKRR
jgi:hypothetical protein